MKNIRSYLIKLEAVNLRTNIFLDARPSIYDGFKFKFLCFGLTSYVNTSI